MRGACVVLLDGASGLVGYSLRERPATARGSALVSEKAGLAAADPHGPPQQEEEEEEEEDEETGMALGYRAATALVFG